MVMNLTSHDASDRVDSPCIEESTHCPCILKVPRVVTPNRSSGAEESTDIQHFHHHSRDDHHHHITTTPPTHTQPPPHAVISSPTTGQSYAIQRVLVQDKTDVSVYMGAPIHYDAHTNRSVALSTHPVVIKGSAGGQAGEQVLTELKASRVLLSSGEPPCHVVPLLDVIRSERSVHLISPFMDSGDLFEQVRAVGCAGGLPEGDVRRYFRHMVLGLMYLRRHGIAHGDVSLENTMLCTSGGGKGPVAHLIDLGSCCVVNGPKGVCSTSKYTFRGKPSYVPPEAVGLSGLPQDQSAESHSCDDQQRDRHKLQEQQQQQQQLQDQRQPPQQHHCHQQHPRHFFRHHHPHPHHHHHHHHENQHHPHPHHPHTQPPSTARAIDPFAADVWSLAVCLYAMLTGHPLYTSPTDPAFMVLVEGRADELLEHYEGFGLCLDRLARHLVLSMLNVCPASRPSYAELLEHPWMRYGDGDEGGAVEMDKLLSHARVKERWGGAVGN